MLTIGDSARSLKSGKFGKVIGYGHQIMNDVYQTTLKVLIIDAKGYIDRIEEDLPSAWQKIDNSGIA